MKTITNQRKFFQVRKEKTYLKRITRKYVLQKKKNAQQVEIKSTPTQFSLKRANSKKYHNIFSIQKVIETLNVFVNSEILKNSEEVDTLSELERLWKNDSFLKKIKRKLLHFFVSCFFNKFTK